MAILSDEPQADACIAILEGAESVCISAVTAAEAMVVSARRGIAAEMLRVMRRFEFRVVPATEETAHRVAAVYDRWGKGVHPAGLNFCDCFAYELARQHDCPLLFVGQDFSRTDVATAL